MLLKPHLLLTGLIMTGTLSAQGPPGVPVPPGANPPQNGNQPLANTVEQNGFLEPKINGERLAELYTKLTGRRVTVSNAAIAAEFRFVQPGPISYGTAATLLRTAATMEGFVFIPSGENHDKLVYTQTVAGPTDEDLPVYTDAADLPQDEQVVTYVMNLKYIKPDEVVRTFTAVVKQFGNYGSIAPVPNASAVIITENTSLIRRLIELQETIDVASSNIETRFIKVQYADVQELSETLNEILNTQQSQQTSAATRRVGNAAPAPAGLPAGINPAGGANADGGGAGEDVPIQIVPNTRTNQIFAMGRPVDVVFAETLVRGFDAPSDTRNFLRRKLKFLAVADFLPVAEQALARAFGASQSGTAGGGSSGAGGRSTGANFGGGNARTTGSSRGGTSATGNSSFGGGGGGNAFGGGGATGGGSALSDPNVSTAPEAMLVGRTLLVADNITNSIVIQGPPAGLEIINQLLDEIDVKADQVMISCVFGQLSLGDDLNYGIDYLRTLDAGDTGSFAGRGGSGGSGALLPLDGTAFDPGAFASGAGLGIYGKIGNYLNVYLTALQASDRFNVISRPTVFITNNQKGTIQSGQEIAVPTNSFNSGTTGQSTNIEYRPVVLSLEVVPLVNSSEEVTLQIYLKNDEVLGSQVIEGVGDVPTIATRELVTTVTVPNNETIVLGGLITTRDRKIKSGIPFLNRIPYVGGLFGSTTNGKDREELLIFIQPKIIRDSSSLYEGQAEVSGRYKIDDDNRDFIDGPAILPARQETIPVSGKRTSSEAVAAPEEDGGPRRASSRPRGFVNRR